MFTKSHVFQALSLHEVSLLPETAEMAAVMVILLITNDENNLEIILTKRATTLAAYAGDTSFPGGMKEKNDIDLLETAKREVFEELNLKANDYQTLAQLNDFQDRYGNVVRPFVSWMHKKDFLALHLINPLEVSELIYFPLNKLSLIHDDPTLHAITKRRPTYSFRENNIFIWGLTATILVHLLDIFRNTPGSVA